MKRFKSPFICVCMVFLCIFLSCTNVKASGNEVLNEARSIIDSYYIDKNPSKTTNNDVNELVQSLNDPYSKYFTQEQYNTFINSINNKFCGIGVYLNFTENGIKVLDVISNSPAEEVGIQSNDVILKISDCEMKGKTLEEALTYIKGNEGTFVKVLIDRSGVTKEFNVQRRVINIPTVESKMLNDICYLKISSFGEDTAELFNSKLNESLKSDPKAYIIDIRNNGGGFLKSALDISGHFIGDNIAIVMEGRDKNKFAYAAQNHTNKFERPVIVLINENSASASEILAAALKDYNKAYFIGNKTFGKGVAQSIFRLTDGSAIKLTTEKFYSPKGNEINKVGILPDFEIKDNKVDPLKVGMLLFSGINDDKAIKLKIGNNDFYVDLKLAKKKEFKEEFKYILANCNKDIEINANSNKENFNINFNDILDSNCANEENIQLFNEKTAENVPLELSYSSSKLSVNLKQKLDKNSVYYMIIKRDINNKDKLKLTKPYIVKINIGD